MVAVPFIYFTFLLVLMLIRNKNRFDVPCFIVSIYSVSAFFSILVDALRLRSADNYSYQISLTATIVYCGLLTLCLMPLYGYSNMKVQEIKPLQNDKLLRIIAWISFTYFVFDLVMNANSLVKVLSGDIAETRNLMYAGEIESGWMSHIPSLLRLPFIFLNHTFGCFWILILLAFFSRYIQKMPKLYFYLFVLASLRYVVGNLLVAGRSAMAYWFLGVMMCYFFFKKYIAKKDKKNLLKLALPSVAIGLLYFSVASQSRFESTLDGTQGGLISYFGQSFINFCYFWDTFQTQHYYWQDIFPFAYLLSGDPILGGVPVNEVLTLQTGKAMGVFYTYIGNIQIATSKYVAILYCVVTTMLAYMLLSHMNSKIYNIKNSYIYLLFSSIMVLGVFTSFYMTSTMTFSAMIFYITFSALSKKNCVVKK